MKISGRRGRSALLLPLTPPPPLYPSREYLSCREDKNDKQALTRGPVLLRAWSNFLREKFTQRRIMILLYNVVYYVVYYGPVESSYTEQGIGLLKEMGTVNELN